LVVVWVSTMSSKYIGRYYSEIICVVRRR
jgi:hypothetical protein